jgi:hypothetical protein
MLANQHPAGGLTKALILRMADRLMAGGRWEQDHVVLDEKTALEVAQERIAELERLLDESSTVQTEAKECLAALWREFEITVDGVDAALGSEDLEAAADAITDTDEARELRKRIAKLGVG